MQKILHGGQKLTKDFRPTSAKVLQALFNILGDVRGDRFLDLFSGSGQVALTAAGKGADVCLVESDRKNFGDILKKITPEIRCVNMDVRRAIPKLLRENAEFDIIFADPPYMLGWGTEFPKLMDKNVKLLAEDGVIIFEHSEREKADFGEQWETENRAYGGTILTFAKRRKNNA